jgi:hypothetical protein
MLYAKFASPRRLLALTLLGVILAAESAFLSKSAETQQLSPVEKSNLEDSELSVTAASFNADDGRHPFKLEQTTKVYTT